MLDNSNISSDLVDNKVINPLTYYIETYGCQMNVSDSELVSSELEKIGYTSSDKIETADLILLNTCSIREKAEETVHNRLDSLHYLKKNNPKLLIGVIGCMAQNLKNELLSSKPYIDIILGPDSYRKISDIIFDRNNQIDHIVDTKLSKYEVYENMFPSRKSGVNAWVSIMRGCDKFCTFCIVPFTRGRERSRTIDSIVEEINLAVNQGFVEITLLGQNVNSYKTPSGDFPILLERVANIKGVKRIRYTSPHPKDINVDLLKVMKKYENICNNIHLPLQSGSTEILRTMNRTYTKEEFLNLVNIIKEYLPSCSISTDIIVGFPGESDYDFNETLEVVKKVEFDFSYMFKYSSRPGTKAAQFTNQIDEDIKQRRLEQLIELQNSIRLKVNKSKIGKVEKVLIEKNSKKSDLFWSGRTDGNIWAVIKKTDEKIKDIVDVLITDAKGVTLFGENINNRGQIS
jgi:tRNA-2-methylthio-N6-dimethylallyladenosine synthase